MPLQTQDQFSCCSSLKLLCRCKSRNFRYFQNVENFNRFCIDLFTSTYPQSVFSSSFKPVRDFMVGGTAQQTNLRKHAFFANFPSKTPAKRTERSQNILMVRDYFCSSRIFGSFERPAAKLRRFEICKVETKIVISQFATEK